MGYIIRQMIWIVSPNHPPGDLIPYENYFPAYLLFNLPTTYHISWLFRGASGGEILLAPKPVRSRSAEFENRV